MDGSVGSKGLASAFESPTFEENASFRLDKPVGSASISPCGRDIVLASRQGLHIIDLDSPWSPPRHLPHHTPWEVADVQWSPFAARDYWVVSTSNQKALVWNLSMRDSRASIEHYLHGHSRAITDINFSAHHPDILATCAVDSYVHCWDLRNPSRAAMTFCDWFAGATQVKWNRQDSHILASSHNKFLRIWDDRKGTSPLRSIEAHATKIYGVDWNRTETKNVATCSLDRTIKFWDYTSDSDKPERTISTPFPVWRARHTPFGSGLLAMPQREDFDLHLYDRRPCDQSQDPYSMPMVHRFDGHQGQVKEFLWRARGSIEDSKDSRDFQLVSWGSDRMLRLHCVDEEVLGKVGYVRGQRVKRTIPFTRKHAVYRSFRADPFIATKDAAGLDQSYPHELDLFDNLSIPSLADAGMSMKPVGGSGVWASGESRSVSIAGRKNRTHEGSDAISWMKGVKIGKRQTTKAGFGQSVPSVLSPSLKASQPWDTFESLAEEITHLADTFSKIDMQSRRIEISLHSSWGPEKISTYLKCKVEIPLGYPTEAPPYPDVESTAGLGDETILQITSDLQVIGDAYRERQRHSLEAMLRYLLQEQSCKDCLSVLRAMPENSGLGPDQLENLSSSDDEDEAEQHYAGIRAPGLDSSDGMLSGAKAQYSVPLPKACGALWADNGRLVCFFPPKPDKAPSLLRPLNSKTIEWSLKDRRSIFGGFGRFGSASPDTRQTSSDLETIHSGDSDFDDSSQSSSGSSSSGDVGVSQVKWMPSIAWRDALQGSKHAVSIDESQKSSGANERTQSSTRNSKNFVSLHDCAELLPAKRQLAVRYALGSDAASCLHNAAVARECGDLDLADVWDFINLIVKDQVPLDRTTVTGGRESILVVARRSIAPLRWKDSAIDLSYDSPDDEHRTKPKGRIHWGAHPFGRQWLVNALFDHFERLADVQMLAMLSCALQSPPNSKNLPKPAAESPSKSGSRHHLTVPEWLPQGVPEHYFASAEIAASILHPPARQPSFTLDMQKPISDPHSTSSSVGASTSDPLTPFSTGFTPPSTFKPSKVVHERSNSQMTISTSPEQYKHLQRSGSNLATAFAASITRPFSFSTPDSSSPPTLQPRKRLSPATSYMGPAASSQVWGALVPSKKSSSKLQPARAWVLPPTSDTGRGDLDGKTGGFATKLKNQGRFHNDGYASEPLLDPARTEQYVAYRSLYANILHAWGLPIVGCQILQYNGLSYPPSTVQGERDLDGRKSLLTLGRDTSTKASHESDDTRLYLRQKCSKCDATLPVGRISKACSRCSERQAPVICHLCHCVIFGLASPCLNCGHVLHLSCRAALEDEDEFLNGACVTGCGCSCDNHLGVDVQMPAIGDQSPPSIPPTHTTINEQEELDWQDVAEDAQTLGSGNWRDVAYESLARNLGGRFLTPKPSQIWRGGETRKASLSGFPAPRRSDSS
ncbi:MAG: hypothetical protein Q9202_005118 [Teloschistes flavicans]